MEIIELPMEQLREAPWNCNQMDPAMMRRLKESISRYGLVQNLVVRPIEGGAYEVLSGNQRLQVLQELGWQNAPCAVVYLDDVHARLLAQALNRIQGEDDLGLKAELLREVLGLISEREVLAILPESSSSLRSLASLGQETMAQQLKVWQQAQGARLRHLHFHLTKAQLEVIEEALARMLPRVKAGPRESPNARGTALYLLCKGFLE